MSVVGVPTLVSSLRGYVDTTIRCVEKCETLTAQRKTFSSRQDATECYFIILRSISLLQQKQQTNGYHRPT